jgi:hypothetical protein
MSVISHHWRICFLQRQTNPVFSVTVIWVRVYLAATSTPIDSFHLVLTEQVAGGIVVPGSGRLITCLGVDDLVIVDMPDTLLVTTRARSQEVKRLVKKTRDAGWKHLL